MHGTELGTVPKLVTTMLTQIWVAHPSLRTEYMILDPNNWDKMPEPLVGSEIFNTKKTGSNSGLGGYGDYSDLGSSVDANKLPWLATGSIT